MPEITQKSMRRTSYTSYIYVAAVLALLAVTGLSRLLPPIRRGGNAR